MAGTKSSGRRSLRDEIGVLERFTQLSPKVFAYVNKCLTSGDPEQERWAMEWLKTGFAKLIPQKIGGDPDNRAPIPLLNVLNVIQHNISDNQDKPDEIEDTSGTRRNVGKQDNLNTHLPDSIGPKR